MKLEELTKQRVDKNTQLVADLEELLIKHKGGLYSQFESIIRDQINRVNAQIENDKELLSTFNPKK